MIHRAAVPITATLRAAMVSMDAIGTGIVLVEGEDQRLVGTLTDGDIRRALLGGARMSTSLRPFVQRGYVAVESSVGRAEVLDLMQARRIDAVPVVDAEGRLVGLHLLHEMLGAAERPNWAVVMAGGLGTRLRPLTDGLPKPMLRVAGRPILERIVLHLVGHGIRRVFLSVGYLAEKIEEHFGDGSRFGCCIEYLRETEPLGTAGALALLPERPEHPLLVLNGDLVTQADLGAMLGAHDGAITMGVRGYSHTIPYGVVKFDGTDVVGIEEKPSVCRSINAGVYVLSPETVARVPEGPVNMTDLVTVALALGEKVGSFEVDGDWVDIGQHEQLRQARGAA